MNIGTPGTGLGGLFYLLSALVMVGIELVRFILGKSKWSQVSVMFTSVGLALGMIITSFGTIWAVGKVFPGLSQIRISSPLQNAAISGPLLDLLNFVLIILITLSPLMLVLAIVQVLRFYYLFIRKK